MHALTLLRMFPEFDSPARRRRAELRTGKGVTTGRWNVCVNAPTDPFSDIRYTDSWV